MSDAIVTKKDLIERMAGELGITKQEAEKYVNFIFDEMSKTLTEKKTVDIYGFGKFTISRRNARTGINPSTKESIEIPATDVIKFKATKKLREAVK